MSNPIRIAQGPPTEAGDYKARIGSTWCMVRVFHFYGRLRANAAGENGLTWVMAEEQFDKYQWSTRIPDPEEGDNG